MVFVDLFSERFLLTGLGRDIGFGFPECVLGDGCCFGFG